MYIGNTVITQGFTPQVDFFSGNASTTAFTLSRPVASTYQMIVVVANVTQNPGSAYSVSGNTITFASAPPSGTNNIWVEYTSLITQTIVPTNSYQVSGPVYTGTQPPLGGATNPITGNTGSANNYIQTYIYNTYNGVNSSADFTAYPSNGSDASGWVDMGITSPSFSQSAYSVTGANEPYLFGSAPSGSSTSGNLVIATDSTGTTNAIQFYTGGFTKAKSAFAMMIDQNSNVGVGVTPSTWKVDVKSGGSGVVTNGIRFIRSGTNQQYGVLNYEGGQFNNVVVNTAGTGCYWGVLYSTDGSTYTNPMTLDNSNNLYLGGSTGGAGVMVWQPNGNATTTPFSVAYGSSNSSSYTYHSMYYTGASQYQFYVDWGGTVHARSITITSLSDQRLKTNIKDISTGLSQILSLQPRNFDWLDGSKTNASGFIAQEFQQIFPNSVTQFKAGKDGIEYLAMNHEELIPSMVKAIQELSAQVTALEAKVA